jgi:hypothetical protein
MKTLVLILGIIPTLAFALTTVYVYKGETVWVNGFGETIILIQTRVYTSKQEALADKVFGCMAAKQVKPHYECVGKITEVTE